MHTVQPLRSDRCAFMQLTDRRNINACAAPAFEAQTVRAERCPDHATPRGAR